MSEPSEENFKNAALIVGAWRVSLSVEDRHYCPMIGHLTSAIALAMDELEREAEQRGAERERERADEAERLLRIVCARINGDQDESLEGMRACQSPELADISISIELAYKRAICARGES